MAEVINKDSLAIPSEVIVGFREGLDYVHGRETHSLPDLSGFIHHGGKFTRPDINFEPGLFLADGYMGQNTEVGETVTTNHLTFNVQPSNRLGREDSHHKVFFGKLISDCLDGEQPTVNEQIAVKPLDNIGTLLGELAMFQYMNMLNLPTFQPVGILVSGTRPHHMITKFEHPVDTMDTVNWQDLNLDERYDQLDYALETAVMLHTKMLFHGDLEFKNVGFNDTGNLVIVDPEWSVSGLNLAKIYRETDDKDLKERALLRLSQLMSKEFSDISRSIDKFIFSGVTNSQKPKTDAAFFKIQKHHLYNPYKNKIIASGSEHTDTLLNAYDIMLHSKKVRAHG